MHLFGLSDSLLRSYSILSDPNAVAKRLLSSVSDCSCGNIVSTSGDCHSSTSALHRARSLVLTKLQGYKGRKWNINEELLEPEREKQAQCSTAFNFDNLFTSSSLSCLCNRTMVLIHNALRHPTTTQP